MTSSTGIGLGRCDRLYPPFYPHLLPSQPPRTSREIGPALASAISPTKLADPEVSKVRASSLEHDLEAQPLCWAPSPRSGAPPLEGKVRARLRARPLLGRTGVLGSRPVLTHQPCVSSEHTRRPTCLSTRPGPLPGPAAGQGLWLQHRQTVPGTLPPYPMGRAAWHRKALWPSWPVWL